MCALVREGLGEAGPHSDTGRGEARPRETVLAGATCRLLHTEAEPFSTLLSRLLSALGIGCCRRPCHWPLSSSLPLAHVRRRQARHATYGAIEAVAGRLVPADPLIAHQDLNNAGEVAGCVVYVKVAALDVFVYRVYTAYTCMYVSTQ